MADAVAVAALAARCTECGDCLLWRGHCNGRGHPKVRNGSARRVMWAALHGKDVPAGRLVTVNCGQAKCLAAGHLVLTTRSAVSRASNARPAVRLKRAVASARTNRARVGKIDMDVARRIRASDRPQAEWAAELGVSTSLVSKVVTGRSWVEHSGPWAGLGGRV